MNQQARYVVDWVSQKTPWSIVVNLQRWRMNQKQNGVAGERLVEVKV